MVSKQSVIDMITEKFECEHTKQLIDKICESIYYMDDEPCVECGFIEDEIDFLIKTIDKTKQS